MHTISSNHLSIKEVETIFLEKKKISLSSQAKNKITTCRVYLDKKINQTKTPIYGINTGFGSLCNVKIEANQLAKLQENLVKSHACGVGNEVPKEIVKLMLLLKIQSLSYGHSGVQLQTVERLIYFYNNDIVPVVFEQGSLGASGDLAPLAHLSLPLLGLGEVYYKEKRISTEQLYRTLKLTPIVLQAKEGLALLNGTQFMSAYGVLCCIKAQQAYDKANLISAISIDGFDCKLEPFDKKLHFIRPHKGQLHTAKEIVALLKGSSICKTKKVQVQDPYSFRCIPQVHGASYDAINYVASVFETEINSVTDNPTIFPAEDEILSGGNFHGQPLAIALDFLCIAIAELASISERRTYLLISGQRNLPAFLTPQPGLNSGLMIPQYTAASIVSQNKQLCTPASVDSIISSNGQEDHVSMGANAATKTLKVIENTQRVLAIEMLTATQALEFKRPLTSSVFIEKIVGDYRKSVKKLVEDKVLSTEINKTVTFLFEAK